jgi:hypothetical protein
MGVISACASFSEWALGRDTLHGALGFIGFGAINMPIGVLPPSISLDISATASVPQVS